MSDDYVNSPPHYKVGDKEVIDVLKDTLSKEEFRGYLKGNAFKYMFRAGKKFDDPTEDFKKARKYQDMLVKDMEERGA